MTPKEKAWKIYTELTNCHYDAKVSRDIFEAGFVAGQYAQPIEINTDAANMIQGLQFRVAELESTREISITIDQPLFSFIDEKDAPAFTQALETVILKCLQKHLNTT